MNQLGSAGGPEFVTDDFRRHAKKLGHDASADRRTAVVLAALAATIGITGAVIAATRVEEGRDLATSTVVPLLFLAASLPAWWLADRYRRSGDESRRLQKHTALFVSFVNGLNDGEREKLMGPLAQTLFARSVEDADPLRLVSWPTSTTAAADE